MKKIILFIAVFAFGNSYGQVLTVVNNSGVTVDFTYQEWDNVNCQSAGTPITITGIGIGTSSPLTLSNPGATHFAWGHFSSGGVTQTNTFLTFITCLMGGNTFSWCPFGSIYQARWTENSSTFDVTTEIF